MLWAFTSFCKENNQSFSLLKKILEQLKSVFSVYIPSCVSGEVNWSTVSMHSYKSVPKAAIILPRTHQYSVITFFVTKCDHCQLLFVKWQQTTSAALYGLMVINVSWSLGVKFCISYNEHCMNYFIHTVFTFFFSKYRHRNPKLSQMLRTSHLHCSTLKECKMEIISRSWRPNKIKLFLTMMFCRWNPMNATGGMISTSWPIATLVVSRPSNQHWCPKQIFT